MFENKVLRKILGPKGRKMVHGENCIMMNFTVWILQPLLLG
jgi:hypothetical protein